jgi:hypothetical protein
MLAATLVGVFLIPVLFVAVERIGLRETGSSLSETMSPLPAQGDH